MADIVSRQKRSRMMSGIRGKNTKPEILIRKALHTRGLRYRLHRKDLPGKPDLVLKKHNTVVFINGCFWHGHECPLFKWPKSNAVFWQEKIEGNRRRDKKNIPLCQSQGWNVIVVWECALRSKPASEKEALFDALESSIRKVEQQRYISYAG